MYAPAVRAWYDLRTAVRSLVRAKALSSVIVVSLALGTGANAAVYSAVDALLFAAPSGVTDPSSLVDIFTSQMNGASYGTSSYADFESLASSAPGLAAIAAADDREDVTVRIDQEVRIARLAAVTPNYWDLLGLHTVAGGWPVSGSTTGPAAVVLSFELAQSLSAASSLIGRTITIADREGIVVAVAPPGFRGLHLDRVYDVWTRLDPESAGTRGDRRLSLIGRLAPGGGIGHVRREADDTATQLAQRFPDTNVGTLRNPDEPRRFTIVGYSRLDPDVRPQAVVLGAVLFGAAALLLLSACVNAGSLLLSRAVARRGELSVKSALGAARGRLLRELLVESVVLAVAGAAAGLLLSSWTSGAIPSLFAPEHAALLDTRVQPRTMTVVLALSGLTGLLFGLGPAILSTRSLAIGRWRGDPSHVSDLPGTSRLRSILVGSQVALSTVLLIATVLLGRVLGTALQADLSLESDSLGLVPTCAVSAGTRDAAMAAVRAVPGVAHAAWIVSPPLARTARRQFDITRAQLRESVELDINFASSDYFRRSGIAVLEGRAFTGRDEAAARRVVVVNDILARRFFADSAVGRTLEEPGGVTAEIVGVVSTPRYRTLQSTPRPVVYYPIAESAAARMYLIVRTKDRFARRAHDIDTALSSVSALGADASITFTDYVSAELATDRMVGALVTVCGCIALALAAVGVYGVTADGVQRRTREFGVRMALGAGPAAIARLVFGTGLRATGGGIALGVGAAALLARGGRAIVYGVPSIHPGTAGAIAAVVVVVASAAVLPSLQRALRVNPADALVPDR